MAARSDFLPKWRPSALALLAGATLLVSSIRRNNTSPDMKVLRTCGTLTARIRRFPVGLCQSTTARAELIDEPARLTTKKEGSIWSTLEVHGEAGNNYKTQSETDHQG